MVLFVLFNFNRFSYFFYNNNVISIVGLKVGHKVTGGGRLGLFGSSFKLFIFFVYKSGPNSINVIGFKSISASNRNRNWCRFEFSLLQCIVKNEGRARGSAQCRFHNSIFHKKGFNSTCMSSVLYGHNIKYKAICTSATAKILWKKIGQDEYHNSIQSYTTISHNLLDKT